jgi:hypothetical protein
MGLAVPDHTVPYGTVLSRTLSRGTSCQATIDVSLRDRLADGSQRHLARSNFVTPFVGAKTSQTALNLAPFGLVSDTSSHLENVSSSHQMGVSLTRPLPSQDKA